MRVIWQRRILLARWFMLLRWSLAAFAAAGHGLAGFAVGGFASLGLALIPKLFALGEGQFQLHSAVLEVHAGRDQGEALLLRLAHQPSQFLLMHQQLTGTEGGVVEYVAVLIRTDMAVQGP